MTNDIEPTNDDAKKTWLKGLEENIDEQAAALNLDAEIVTDMKTAASEIIKSIEVADEAGTSYHAAIAAKKAADAKGMKVIRIGIKEIKGKKNFTPAIGQILGIMGTNSEFIADEVKPELKTVVFPGHVTIKFTKKGVEGVNIYTRLKGQAAWTKLSYDSHSPYEDNRPLAVVATPEHREYMAIGVYQDKEVGQQSDIVEAVFGG